jgi:hypothetical protein
MKWKRILLILGCLAAMLLAGYATLRLTGPTPHRITKENCEAIQLGMTEEEVKGLLGVPGDYSTGSQEDDNAKIELLKGTGEFWIADAVAIRVVFDEAGQVAVIWVSERPNRPESFLAKLRRWLGM